MSGGPAATKGLAFFGPFTAADPAASAMEFVAKGHPLPANHVPLLKWLTPKPPEVYYETARSDLGPKVHALDQRSW
jgi:hypothetical protein